jgi:hypothetical protein
VIEHFDSATIGGICFLMGALVGGFLACVLMVLELRHSTAACECKQHPMKIVLHVGDVEEPNNAD